MLIVFMCKKNKRNHFLFNYLIAAELQLNLVNLLGIEVFS